MRVNFVLPEVVTGLRRNLTMTVAMILTTAISLGLVGTGLLAVRMIDRTEEIYYDKVQVSITRTSRPTTPTAAQPVCAGLERRWRLAAERRRYRTRPRSRPTSATSSCSPGRQLVDARCDRSAAGELRVELVNPERWR